MTKTPDIHNSQEEADLLVVSRNPSMTAWLHALTKNIVALGQHGGGAESTRQEEARDRTSR